ncbi:MAG: hypothetical protein GXO87_10135 [Chlorobi bacterium]|nr:hypothetical protein [Chlorobiota bacterium]
MQNAVEKIVGQNSGLELLIYDVESAKDFPAQIVPTLYIEDELFAIGEFDLGKLKSAVS